MSAHIALEVFTKALSEMITETFEQVHGIYLDRGTSLFETLETISAEEASRPVSATCSSIAGQVEHVRFYLAVLARYARGEQVEKIDWADSWQLQKVSPEGWEALKGRLREAHRDILAIVADEQMWGNADAIGGSMAIVVHTAYHLGEIRQALCTIKGR